MTAPIPFPSDWQRFTDDVRAAVGKYAPPARCDTGAPMPLSTLASLEADVNKLKTQNAGLVSEVLRVQLASSILLEILGQDHIKGHLTPTDLRHMAAVKGN